jgi:hypothetical protein
MRDDTQKGVHMLEKVTQLMEATRASPQYGDGAKQYERLKIHVDRAKLLGREQDLHDRNYHGAVREAKTLVRNLKRKAIQPIARLANGLLPEDPKLAEPILMEDLGSYEAVITVALNLAERAEPHKAKFVDAGLKADFIENLRADVAKLQNVLKERDEHLNLRIGATAAVEAEYARGKELVRVLDVMFRAEWENNPEMLARWESVTRFPSAGSSGESTEEDTSTQPVDGGSAPAPGPAAGDTSNGSTNPSTDSDVA